MYKKWQCVLKGPTLEGIRDMLFNSLLSDHSRTLRLDADDYIDQHAIAEAAVAHYKGAKFDRTASLRLSVPGQPGVDTEGFVVSSLMMYFLRSQIHLCLVYLKGDQNDCDPLFANHLSHLAC